MNLDQGMVDPRSRFLDSNFLEDVKNWCDVIDHYHKNSLVRRILLNALAVNVTDVTRTCEDV